MIAIVTGASSGFGFEVCKQLIEKDYTVYGISRRKHAPDGVTALCPALSGFLFRKQICDQFCGACAPKRGA